MCSIKHFRDELKIKIQTLDTEFDALAERMVCSELASQEIVRNFAARLYRRISRKRLVRGAAETLLDQRVCDPTNLHKCEDCVVPWGGGTRTRALAAMDIASVALDEAAYAALEAWMAEMSAAATPTQSESDEAQKP